MALRHESDLASAISAGGLWSRAGETASAVSSRVLAYLVEARRQNPPTESDRAFRTLPETIGDAGVDCANEREALGILTQLESAALVESVGAHVGPRRFRATDHAVHAATASRAA